MTDIAFTVRSELPELVTYLRKFYPAQWKPILADALTQTGYYVLNKYQQQLPAFFDRPTPYTINSMYLKPATPNRLEATVQWKEGKEVSAGRYLAPEVTGGSRSTKRFEVSLQRSGQMPQGYFAVPTDDVQLDAFGNVSRGLITKILSALQSSNDPTQNKTVQKGYKGKSDGFIKRYRGGFVDQGKAIAADKRARAKSAKYFTIQPGTPGLYPGVYESVVLFGGRGSRRLFSFVKAVDYKATFPFEKIGADAAAAKFGQKVQDAIDKVVGK